MLIWLVWLVDVDSDVLEEVFDSREKAQQYINDNGKYIYQITTRTVN